MINYIAGTLIVLNTLLVLLGLRYILKSIAKPLDRFWIAVYLLLFIGTQVVASWYLLTL